MTNMERDAGYHYIAPPKDEEVKVKAEYILLGLLGCLKIFHYNSIKLTSTEEVTYSICVKCSKHHEYL